MSTKKKKKIVVEVKEYFIYGIMRKYIFFLIVNRQIVIFISFLTANYEI